MSEYYHCFLGGVADIFYPGIPGALQPQAKKKKKKKRAEADELSVVLL